MGISVNQIKKDVRPLELSYGDQTINIKYKPSEWTPAIEDEWASSDGSQSEAFLEFLTRLVVDWDIFEDDEQQVKLPISFESFKALPMAISMGIISAVAEDSAPGKESKTSSSGTSRRRG